MHPITPLPSVDISDLRKDIVAHITTKRRRFHVKNAEIEDLAQSTLTKVVASIGNYQLERRDFRAWVFGIVHHVLCRHARDRQRYNARFSEHSHNLDEYEAPDLSPEQCVQRAQATREISHAIDTLEPKHRAVFTLHALEKIPHAEIGKRVKMSEAATQKCYQRTRDKLAQCLDDELLIDMPLVVMSCHDKRSDQRAQRWSWVYYGGHYTSQLASLVAASFLAFSLKTSPHLGSTEVPTMDYVLLPVAVQQDKPVPVLPSETPKPQDKPLDKREPVPVPRVRVVQSTSKTTVSKPTPKTHVPSYNPPASPASFFQRGR